MRQALQQSRGAALATIFGHSCCVPAEGRAFAYAECTRKLALQDFYIKPEALAGGNSHYAPCHFRIKPTHAIRTDDKIRWIEYVTSDEFQHVPIHHWPKWLH